MIPQQLKNDQLSLNFNFWNGIRKNERIYIASEIMKQLGYTGGRSVLKSLELEEDVDMILVKKQLYPNFFKVLRTLNVLGERYDSSRN